MIQRLFVTLILILSTVVFTAGAQSASDRAGISNTIGFGPRIGYYNATHADDGEFYYGFQVRIRPGAFIGIEAAAEYRPGQEFGIGNTTVKPNFIPLTLSLLMFAPISEHIAPYGVAGLGAYFIKYEQSGMLDVLGFEKETDFNLGYHLGFGLEIPFNTIVALSIDYRYLFLNPNDNEESFNDTDFNGNTVSTSLMFYFR